MTAGSSNSCSQRSVSWRGLLEVALLLGLVGGPLGLLGRWHWALDLASHFQWQWLGCSVLALAVAVIARRRWLIVASFAAVVLAGMRIAELRGAGGSEVVVKPQRSFTVVSFNVLSSNREPGAVAAALVNLDADLVWLMEVTPAWEEALEPLAGRYPHRWVEYRSDNFGIACFTRLKALEGEVFDPSGEGISSLWVNFEVDGAAVTFVGTHPLPPTGRPNAISRDQQLAAVGDWIASRPGATLLAGDLNATAWSAAFKDLCDRSGLAHRSTVPSWQPTWLARGPLAIPIDHILASRELAVVERVVGPSLGSDHRWVWARVVLR